MRAQRAARDAGEQSVRTAQLTQQLARLVSARGARMVSCYLPVAGEPDTSGFIAWARTHDIEVLLPSARSDGLLDWIRPLNDTTVAGAFGIPEPLGEHLSPLAVGEVDLMLIPACAVDQQGVRLGWGRGYFDRNLAALRCPPPVYAVVHEEELLPQLPYESHDVPVQGVITSARILEFTQGDPPARG